MTFKKLNTSEDFEPSLLDSFQNVCYKPSDGLLTDCVTMECSLRDASLQTSHFVHSSI